MDLSFQELSCVVNVKSVKKDDKAPATKTILNGVSGKCQAGRLQAIMGPSGAGKTTLLDVLSGRKVQTSGQVLLAEQPVTREVIRRYAAYVQQDDAIMASQTAREAVHMAALLTLPADMARADKIYRAEKTLKDFQLDSCADTPVGDPVGKMKGLSGGERKRCAVAMSAVREPKILFLDEPTSGLDAYKAKLLVKIIKEMAQRASSTVVCTIHQPSSDIFVLFDDLMLLLGGCTVFNDVAVDAVPHFATAGFQCPQYANPADFLFMHVLTTEDGESAAGERQDQLVEAWTKSGREKARLSASNATPTATPSERVRPLSGSRPAAGCLSAFPVLLKRGVNDLKRNKMRGRAPIAQSVVMALILGVIWWQVEGDQKGMQDRVGFVFFVCVNAIMRDVIGVLTTFANERGAVLREQENGLYTTLPYFMARVLVDIPLKVVGPVLFASISYWMVGLQRDVEKYLLFVTFNILLALSGNSIGLFLACVFPDVAVGLAVAPLFLMPLIMFSGYVLNTDSIPVFLTWLEWLSPPKYAFAAMVQTEFTGLKLECTADQYRTVTAENGQQVRVCAFETGEAFVETLNIQEFLTVEACMGLLAVLIIAFMLLALAALMRISAKSRSQS